MTLRIHTDLIRPDAPVDGSRALPTTHGYRVVATHGFTGTGYHEATLAYFTVDDVTIDPAVPHVKGHADWQEARLAADRYSGAANKEGA